VFYPVFYPVFYHVFYTRDVKRDVPLCSSLHCDVHTALWERCERETRGVDVECEWRWLVTSFRRVLDYTGTHITATSLTPDSLSRCTGTQITEYMYILHSYTSTRLIV